MRVALYARVSTFDKGQDNDNQLLVLREYCLKQGYEVVKEYCDHVTGSRGDRKGFRELYKDASRRRFDLVLFWSLDRFTREGVLETLQRLKELDHYGVYWRSYTEQYLDSTGIFKDAILAILAAIAQQERLRISERTKAGLARARKYRSWEPKKLVADFDLVRAVYAKTKSCRLTAEQFDMSRESVRNIVNRKKRWAINDETTPANG